MMAAVTSEALQNDGIAHALEAGGMDPVKYLVDAPEYARLCATPHFHLGHEWQGISFTPAIKRRKNLVAREYFHQLSGP